jgi:hypothetical protein
VCAETEEPRLPDGASARLVATGGAAVLQVDRGESSVVVPDQVPAGTAELVARSLAPLRTVSARRTTAATVRRAVALRWFDVAPPPPATEVPRS